MSTSTSTSNPLARALLIVTLLAAIGATVWWQRQLTGERPTIIAPVEPPAVTLAPDEDQPAETASFEQYASLPAPYAAALHEIPQTEHQEWTASSWESPLDSSYWKSAGCTFDAEGMTLGGETPGWATFGRPYYKLMFSCEIAELSSQQRLEMRLVSPDKSMATLLTISADGAAACSETKQRIRGLEESMQPLDVAGEKPHRLRLAATGNRLIVAWDNHRVLTASQPAVQSGHTFFLSLYCPSGPLTLGKLRFEGE